MERAFGQSWSVCLRASEVLLFLLPLSMLRWMQQRMSSFQPATRRALLLVAGLLFLIVIIAPEPLLAQAGLEDTFGVQAFEQSTSLGGSDIRIVIAKIIRAILGLLGTIAVVIMAYAGYLIMTSGGNEDEVQKGKKTMINATIGLLIILSSFTIVQFVLNRLEAELLGRGERGVTGRAPVFDTFAASGALGNVIRDHYPFRNQPDVKRNARIAVTFREPVDPASLIANTNGSCWERANPIDCNFAAGHTPRYGDCLERSDFDRGRDCDRLVTSSVRIVATGNSANRIEAAVLTPPTETNTSTYTFVFWPLGFLGSNTSSVRYSVDLTSNILRPRINNAQATSIFDRTPGGHYEWQFETDTQFDTSPPSVVYTYPNDGDTIDRNTIIQVTFNEAMDPTVVQGVTESFTHILLGTSTPEAGSPPGDWRISNGYRTVEFVPRNPCGQNSCGELMYCLPIVCPVNNLDCSLAYRALIRTADLFSESGGSFEAVPFSGVMDISGNALDSSSNRVRGVLQPDRPPQLARPHKPNVGNARQIDPNERAPDNYWWDFSVRNRIDRRVPYVQSVTPPLDAEDIPEDSPLEILFSQVMWNQTLGNIGLEEYPSGVRGLEAIWHVPWSQVDTEAGVAKTRALLQHRAFGPNDLDLYYFVSVPSTVKGVNQNCVYPGRGPIDTATDRSPRCVYEVSEQGQPVPGTGANCAPVTSASSTDTACIQTSLPTDRGQNLRLQRDIPSCLSTMRRPDVSPPPR